MRFSEVFPPLETALELQPEELAPFLLRHLASMGQNNINRHNYTLESNPDLAAYAGGHRGEFCERLIEAWMWLERELFLAPRPGTQGDWMFITRRGMDVLDSQDFSAYSKGPLLPDENLDPILVRKVKPAFIRGDYDTAVFQAFKEVEVRVRKKAGLTAGDLGVALMRKAFYPGGMLAHDTQEKGEQIAEAELFSGAVGTFKNPGSHREVDFSDPAEVADIIRFANQLLRMVQRKLEPTI
jgi:uncharacterized protein (TIGR02391 family)